MKAWVLGALLWAPVLGHADEIMPAAAESIQSEEALTASVESYLARYRAARATPAPAVPSPADSPPEEPGPGEGPEALLSPGDALSRVLDRVFDEQTETTRPAIALGEEAAKLGNGGTIFNRKLRLTAAGLEGSTAPTYNAFVAGLLATYIARPADRDAILLLLKEISRQLENRAPESYVHPVAQGFYDGLFMVFPAVVVFDWRGGFAGLRRDSQNFFRFAVSRSKRLFSPAGLGGKPTASAAAAATPPPGLGTALVAIAQKARRQAKEDPWRFAAFDIKRSMKTFASQLVRAGAVGGLPGALIGFGDASEPVKSDPLLALEVAQDLVAADLEIRALRYREQVELLTSSYRQAGSLDEKKVLAEAGKLTPQIETLINGASGLDGLRAELLHLQKNAKRLGGQVPFPQIAADLDQALRDVRTVHWGESPAERRNQLLSASAKLADPLRALYASVEKEKIARGIGPGEPLFVSLAPIEANLSVAAFYLAQLGSVLLEQKGAAKPGPDAP